VLSPLPGDLGPVLNGRSGAPPRPPLELAQTWSVPPSPPPAPPQAEPPVRPVTLSPAVTPWPPPQAFLDETEPPPRPPASLADAGKAAFLTPAGPDGSGAEASASRGRALLLAGAVLAALAAAAVILWWRR
jgi:hypothetical protein